ncbi:hypothetical protein BEWA_025040 [Theileria equi strain WA]|uniref:CPL domain-containing protein n=1 Tax=Theileria equi strain WA TaxID=1537102 RepID=L0AVS9_THEEQ|nr:hypothetical protein BEWA_025040 [Theileria equi strain WA]AFZ79655.1 hypothetical protein BEWA_025040 [Theileria equi strain WA]|eukprot:XP_004829321.1 hypothetical protein BEWA_025040 [Theileria equi strain WA]
MGKKVEKRVKGPKNASKDPKNVKKDRVNLKQKKGRPLKKGGGKKKLVGKGKNDLKTAKKKVSARESKLEFKKRLNKMYSNLLLEHRDSAKTQKTIGLLLKELGTDYCTSSNKRNVSRILQACLKYGDVEVKRSIAEVVKGNFNISNLNLHSSRFLIKLYHYCNTEVKQYLSNAFFNDKDKKLLFSRYGSDIMDIMYSKMKNKEQLATLKLYTLSNAFLLNHDLTRQILSANSISQFINIILESPDKDSCKEKLSSVITKLVEKELFTSSLSHDLLYIYLHLIDDFGELISQLYKVFGQLLSTRNGNFTLCKLFGHATSKIRKFIVKTLKTDFPEAIYNRINVSFVIKAVMCTDDTKLTLQYLIKPHQETLKEVIFHPFAHRFVLAIVDPQPLVDSPTSVKDQETRQKELQEGIVPNLVELFNQLDLKNALEDKFASAVLLHTLKLSKDQELLKKILSVFSDSVNEGLGLLENQISLWFLQSLIKPSNKVSYELSGLKLPELIWEFLKGKVKDLLLSKAVFLLVDLYEASVKHENGSLVSEMKDTVTMKDIKKCKKILGEDKCTGINLLEKLVNGKED